MTIVSNRRLRNRGAFRWIIAKQSGILAKFRGPASGEKRQMYYFRPEATLRYSALLVVQKLGAKLERRTKVEA